MLNEKQKEVVLYDVGSLVNIAGPGSGKTETLIQKIKYINENKKISNLNELLVLTFTNAAAREIKHRALQKIQTTNDLYFGTFHSMFLKLLKENNSLEKYYDNLIPSIVSNNDLIRFMFKYLKSEFENNSNKIFNKYVSFLEMKKIEEKNKIKLNVTAIKNMVSLDKIYYDFEKEINILTNVSIENKTLKDIYIDNKNKIINKIKLEINLLLEKKKNEKDLKYISNTLGLFLLENKEEINNIIELIEKSIDYIIETKQNQKIITFNDVLLLTLYSFSKDTILNNKIKNKFKYIFVDEYQDTNIIEYEILKLISTGNNICVIGDPLQSIYGFLGANIRNIIEAKKSFNANTIQLIENYRSSKNIVELTNYFAKNMIENVENWQPCVSSNKFVKNKKIKIYTNFNFSNQTSEKIIIDKVKESLDNNKKIAFIQRTGMTAFLENVLIKNKISFNKIGGLTIQESVEVQLFINLILYLLEDKKISLIKILENTQGIGEKSIVDFLLEEKVNKKIKELIDELEKIKIKENIDKQKILNYFEEKLLKNLSKNWKQQRLNEAQQRLEVLKDRFLEIEDKKELSIFLNEYLLDEVKSKDQKHNTTITTIHGAKGLEWDNVILMDWNVESFLRDDIKEGQRLNYVAVSRAKEELIIISNKNSIYQLDNDYIENEKELFEIIDLNKQIENNIIINFGKYKGMSIESVCEIDDKYLKWILEKKDELLYKKIINDNLVNKIEKILNK